MRAFVDRPERRGAVEGAPVVEAEPSPNRAQRPRGREPFASARALLERIEATELALDSFQVSEDGDVFAKCREFQHWVSGMRAERLYQRFYRQTLTGPVDARVTLVDDIHGVEREFVCWDSSSYLGLHLHPRVLEAVERATRQFGYGTPSSPLSSGTNRHSRELERALAEFHGREDAVVFASGSGASAGVLRALAGPRVAVACDAAAHATLRESWKASGAGVLEQFARADAASLDQALGRAEAAGCRGKLVVTDGLSGVHGAVAPLPALSGVCRARGARLLVDDAHGLGVLGPNGGGIEEAFGLEGSVDVLLGTLSTALGSVGGYVCGSLELCDYLRWFAPSAALVAALPAPICAGARVALEVVRAEPEHRERLWENARLLGAGLRSLGFAAPEPDSPIVALPIASQALLWRVSRELFDAGIKCDNVVSPAGAAARSACVLRLRANARHTPDDLDYTVDVLGRVARRHGLVARLQEAGGFGA